MTEEDKSTMFAMWNDGHPASRLAEHFRTTRSAIIGYICRGRKTHTLRGDEQRIAERVRKIRMQVKSSLRPKVPVVVDVPCPEPLNLKLAQLTKQTCKFPVNEWDIGRGDDARFCGAGRDPIQKGGYCPYHQKVASGGLPSPPRNPRKMIASRAL